MGRKLLAASLTTGLSLLITPLALGEQNLFIWNRTDSAPRGLYLKQSVPPQRGDWTLLSSSSETARWIASHGYIAHDWPIVKRVAGVSGDEICRDRTWILVNGDIAAKAQIHDGLSQELPIWRGCFVLKTDEVFLLNDHPMSLDGRYFGAEKRSDLLGSAKLIWRSS